MTVTEASQAATKAVLKNLFDEEGGGGVEEDNKKVVPNTAEDDVTTTTNRVLPKPGAVSVQPTGSQDESWLADDDDPPIRQQRQLVSALDAELALDEDEKLEKELTNRMESLTINASDVKTLPRKSTTDNKNPSKACLLTSLTAIGIICLAVSLGVMLTSKETTTDSGSSTTLPDVDLVSDDVDEDDTGTTVDLSLIVRQIVSPIVINVDDLENLSSPRYQALDWLIHYDELTQGLIGDMTSMNDAAGQDDIKQVIKERFIMSLFFHCTDGPNWSFMEGYMNETASVCDWYGLECDDTGSIAEINLDNNNLNGTIPPELYELDLVSLRFDSNAISSTISSKIGELFRLEEFSADKNYITGTLPDSMALLSNLEHLSLKGNEITGSLPSNLFKLEALRYAKLDNNMLTGSIPDFDNQKLTMLYLYSNLLTGSLPTSIYSLGRLIQLWLFDNQLNSTIATLIGDLSSLAVAYLDVNDFEGAIPSEMGRLSNLFDFWISYNQISGPLPSELGTLSRFEFFYADNNMISGTIPSEIGLIPVLRELYLSNTAITGIVPSEIASIPTLGFLNVGNTSVGQNAFENFCELNGHTAATSDCLGDDPEVDCPCCSSCCNDQSGECELNFPAICQLGLNRWLDSFNQERGPTCECSADGTSFSCLDESCLSCNLDGSICAQSVNSTFTFDSRGLTQYFRNEWKYFQMDGHGTIVNRTVAFVNEKDDLDVPVSSFFVSATAAVNQQPNKCTAAFWQTCLDGSGYHGVNCDNLDGVGSVLLCDNDENLDDIGPLLTIVKLQDDNYLSDGSCPPLFGGLEAV